MLEDVLRFYNFTNPKADLIRHNENITYKITDDNGQYVLRIHQPIEGFNLDFLRMGKNKVQQINSETELLLYLEGQEDILTQKVVKNNFGDIVTIPEDEVPITVLCWLEGKTLDMVEITEDIAHEIGAMLGRLHKHLQNASIENRYRYDDKLLDKMIEEAHTAQLLGHFNNKHTKILTDTLILIRDYLLQSTNRFVLVHSDLAKSNLIINNNNISPIDFSLSGYCIPEMDLASVFSHINDDILNKIILDAYMSIGGHKPQQKGIEVCFCLQILLFLIVQHNKIAGQDWLEGKLDEWCENQFVPLLSNSNVINNIGLYS